MSDKNDDGVYEAEILYGYTNLIFVCMNSNAANNWNNKVLQTENLELTENVNCYRIGNALNANAWYNYPCTHSFTDATCTETEHCTECGLVTGAALGHTWAEEVWTVVTAPTTDADGVKSRECSVCGTVTDAILRQAEVKPMLYLTPNSNWKADNARFAAYFFGNGERWVDMTYNSELKVYEVAVPQDKTFPNVIFCRMNPSASANNWTNRWNQTADLKVPTNGTNHYTVKEGTWSHGGGTWTTVTVVVEHEHVYYPATCTTVQTCYQCGDTHGELGEHTYGEWNDVVPSTCKVTGTLGHYTCSVCEKNFDIDKAPLESLVIDIDPNAHFDGDEDNNCDYCKTSLCEEHTWNDGDVVIPATCTTPGTKKLTCAACGATKEGVIEATGHSYNKTVVTPATCTEAGYITITCRNCEKSFVSGTDPEADQYLIDYPFFKLDVLGHDMVTDEAKAPTCTETGLTEGSHCSRCDDVTTAQEEVPATGHSYNKTVVTPATCTEDGYITITCRNCEKSFVSGTDPEADQYLIDYPFFNISKKGHDEVSHEAQAATCTEIGWNAYVTCTRCDYSTYEEIDALGHRLENWIQLDPTCTKAGYTAHQRCSREGCGYTSPYFDLAPKGHTAGETVVENNTPATCTDDGSYDNVVYCTVCGEELSRKTVTVPAGHKYEHVVTAPTCTAGGYTTHTCSVCGDKYTDSVTEKIAHTEMTLEAVAPTCSTTGLTAGKKCSVCGNTTVEQTEVAKLPHTEVVDAAVDATCTTDGKTAGSHCDVCGEVIIAQTVITALGHTEVADAAVEATCTTDGKTAGSHCDVCGEILVAQEIIPANHTNANDDNYCDVCGVRMPEQGSNIVFEFGSNGNASHVDGSSSKTTYTETKNGVTLSITSGTNMYPSSYDAKGNSCIKLGTSSKAGSFSFTVPVDVTSVVINVAKYKANSASVTINGTKYTLTKNSNDGQYNAITVDTSSTKTVTLTVSSGYRAMVNSIEFPGCYHEYNTIPEIVDAGCETTGSITSTCMHCGTKAVETTEATGHEWSEWAGTEPTETEDGVKTRTCGNCNKVETDITPALGHEHSFVPTVTAPTCTERGYTTYNCACGEDSYVSDYVDTIDHNYENGKCTECGEKDPNAKTLQKASSIAVGDQIVIVCESKKMELTGMDSSKGLNTAYSSAPAGTYVLTVVAGSTSGTFALKTSDGKYLSWSSKNTLTTSTSITANSSWNITFSNGNATIANASDNTRKLQYNASSPRFCCYTSSQTAVQIYKFA